MFQYLPEPAETVEHPKTRRSKNIVESLETGTNRTQNVLLSSGHNMLVRFLLKVEKKRCVSQVKQLLPWKKAPRDQKHCSISPSEVNTKEGMDGLYVGVGVFAYLLFKNNQISWK